MSVLIHHLGQTPQSLELIEAKRRLQEKETGMKEFALLVAAALLGTLFIYKLGEQVDRAQQIAENSNANIGIVSNLVSTVEPILNQLEAERVEASKTQEALVSRVELVNNLVGAVATSISELADMAPTPPPSLTPNAP